MKLEIGENFSLTNKSIPAIYKIIQNPDCINKKTQIYFN